MTANLMTVYDGTRALGEIEDHLREGVRANLGVGRGRTPLGTYADRRWAMRALSQTANAYQAVPQMRHTGTTTPAPAGSGNRRQRVGINRLDISIRSTHVSVTQRDFGPLTGAEFAVHILTTRFQIALDVAGLIAGLANLGGAP